MEGGFSMNARVLVFTLAIVGHVGSRAAMAQEKEKESGRLPPYYNKVVTDEQRDKIYEIQQKSAERIAALERELAAAKLKLDADIASVLTPAQRDQVVQLRIDADQKRAAAKRVKGPQKKPAKPGAAKNPVKKPAKAA
jgi:Spy/CpxP family protein refolding chaperone